MPSRARPAFRSFSRFTKRHYVTFFLSFSPRATDSFAVVPFLRGSVGAEAVPSLLSSGTYIATSIAGTVFMELRVSRLESRDCMAVCMLGHHSRLAWGGWGYGEGWSWHTMVLSKQGRGVAKDHAAKGTGLSRLRGAKRTGHDEKRRRVMVVYNDSFYRVKTLAMGTPQYMLAATIAPTLIVAVMSRFTALLSSRPRPESTTRLASSSSFFACGE